MTLDPARDTRIQSAVGLAVEAGVGGVTISPAVEIGAVWAKIGDPDPYEDDRYEWREVYSDEKGEFHEYEQAGVAQGGGRGSIRHNNRLYEPAVEVNGKATEAGTIVRLIPSDLMVDPNAETTASHRTWMFANPLTGLRPFVLTEDLIPTGGGEPDLTVAARWLDVLEVETVALFPPHQSGFDTSTFFSLGIGQPDGAYHRGTYGWAQWQPKARAEITADGLTWHGEWQVVTMYAQTIAQVLIEDADIAAGAVGNATLYWLDTNAPAPAMIDSGYKVRLFNDLAAALPIGEVLKAQFNRGQYVWTPIDRHAMHGISIRQSAGQESTNAYVVLSCDVTMDSFGVALARNGNTIKNVSGVPVIGLASWQVCAQRYLTGTLPPDCDAILHAILYNNGAAVVGTESRLSSSRRLVLGGGPKAVNTLSGSIVLQIAAGQAIDLRIMHSLSTSDALDKYVTVADCSHLTFHTIPNVTLNP